MTQQKGFTLVETAVAIGVVAMLSGIVIPLVVKNIHDSKLARANNDLQVIAGAIADQQRTMGRRPRAVGPAGCTGAGHAFWYSGTPGSPIQAVANAPAGWDRGANNFENLFSSGPADAANTLFGFPAAARNQFSYQGPYLGAEASQKVDPWGNPYVIIGYNANGATNGNPIYIVSAGPNGTFNSANLGAGAPPAAADGAPPAAPPLNDPPANWAYTNGSESNIVLRVN